MTQTPQLAEPHRGSLQPTGPRALGCLKHAFTILKFLIVHFCHVLDLANYVANCAKI